MSNSKNGSSTSLGATGGANNGSGPHKNKPVESLTEIFRCFICMEKLRDAHMCPNCSKLCCYGCIQRWLTETRSQCPHCRSQLFLNEVINCRWAEEVTQQLDNLIGATSSNYVPGLLMPDKASKSKFDSILMSHADQDKERCKTHVGEQLSVYCVTCKHCICASCALWNSSHHGHTFKPIEEIYNVQCQLIKDHVLNLRRRFMEIIGSVQEIEKNIDYATTTKDLHVREIRNSVDQMIGRLESYLKTKLMTLVNQKGHLNRKSEEIDNLLQHIESQLSSCPKSELITVAPKLMSCIEDTLQRCAYNVTPVNIDFQSEIVPKYSTANVVVSNFSKLREKGEPFYSDPLQVYGHMWRLKIYPNGNGVVRGSYLSLFLELTVGPTEIAKYEYRIEMIYQTSFDPTKNMLREFSSDFEVGECWGYNRFFRLDLLESEGFWIPEVDILQFKFDVRATTYYQKCKDIEWYIQQIKPKPLEAVGGCSGAAAIESSLSPLLSELSNRVAKLVVENTPKSDSNAAESSSKDNNASSSGMMMTREADSGHSSKTSKSTTNVASDSKPKRSSEPARATNNSGGNKPRNSISFLELEESEISRTQPPREIQMSPTTTSILSLSSYLPNGANGNDPLRTELNPQSAFYEEYLEVCGPDNNNIDNNMEESYFASPDEDEEE